MAWRFSVVSLGLALTFMASGCDCAGPTPGRACSSPSDCRVTEICLDGECTLRGDAGRVDGGEVLVDGAMCTAERLCSGGRCCPETDECVAGFQCLPICENTRCGDDESICCDAGQICLDGVVCAAMCEPGRALCGAGLDVCCGAGEVCLDEVCTPPGDACEDDFDCAEGSYCEEVLGDASSAGRCLVIPSAMCEVRPTFDRLALAVEWHWPGVTVGGTTYENVIATPVVGDVSGDGIPDVVVPVYAGSSLTTTLLVAIHGRTGETLWTIGGADRPANVDTVLIADFDPSDDALEIAYRTSASAIRIVDGDGVTELGRRTTGSSATSRASAAAADLDADGVPDLIIGCHAMNGADISNPARDFFDGGTCRSTGAGGAFTVVANLDGDPAPEVTSGGIAYNIDGSVLWSRSGTPHGMAAVADLDGDGTPEVISVDAGTIVVVAGADGSMLIGPIGSWASGTFNIPGAGTGGAPTVADFDADGLPEISTAGRSAYVVYDPDCLPTPPRAGGDCAPGRTDFIRWTSPTQDFSSSVTGSSVFDFQGDGVAEVIYNDECFLHVYDGATGVDVLEMPRPNSSRTGFEYPIVVDVDRDGNSEIVVTANRDQAVTRDRCPAAYSTTFGVPVAELDPEYAIGTRGVYVFGDPMDRWVRTRPIWNQFTYHVTHIGDLGSSPAIELDNWSVPGLNNYRQNVQGAGVFNAPNLVVELAAVSACGRGEVRLSAVVRNIGARGAAPGVTVTFVQTVPGPEMVLGSATTTSALLPGGSERLTFVAAAVPVDTDLTYEARVDGSTATRPVLECNADDNVSSDTERCDSLL